jgi:hypothetical protein
MGVFDDVAEMGVAVVADDLVQRDGYWGVVLDFQDLCGVMPISLASSSSWSGGRPWQDVS